VAYRLAAGDSASGPEMFQFRSNPFLGLLFSDVTTEASVEYVCRGLIGHGSARHQTLARADG
jgi:hypothetical protein